MKISLGTELWRAAVETPAQSLPFTLLRVLCSDSGSAPKVGNGNELFHLKRLRALKSPERSSPPKLLWSPAGLGCTGDVGDSQKLSVQPALSAQK